MHAHGIDVLEGADDDATVVIGARDQKRGLLPAEYRLLDQHLAGGRGIEPALNDLEKLLAVIGDAAAGAAEGERGTDDGGEPDILHGVECLDEALLDIAPPPLAFLPRPVRLESRERTGPFLLVGVGR